MKKILLFSVFNLLCIVAVIAQQKIDISGSHLSKGITVFAPGMVSTQHSERDLAISPDGDMIVFTRGNYNQTKRALCYMEKQDELWSEVELLPFSGEYNDIEPFFHPNGGHLYFASNRPNGIDSDKSDYNIYVVDRMEKGWSDLRSVSSSINTDADEFFPSVSANGNLYFTATYENGMGKEDIFISRWVDGEYQQPTPLDSAINSATYEFNAFVSPDERILVFSSYGRADDLGGGDLYISQKNESGNWQPARHLNEPINSIGLDYCPFIDFARNTFYFTSQRSGEMSKRYSSAADFINYLSSPGNGMGDIYQVDLKLLEIDK